LNSKTDIMWYNCGKFICKRNRRRRKEKKNDDDPI